MKFPVNSASEIYFGNTSINEVYLGSNKIWPMTPAFSPTDISGLLLWLDASDSSTLYDATSGGSLVAADGTIGRWEDKSGNNRHATQSTIASRPIRKTSIQAGKDVVRFDGSNDFFNISSLNGLANSYTFFGVAKRASVNSNFCFAGVAQAGGSNYFPAFARIRASENTYVLAANGGAPEEDNHSTYSTSNAFGSTSWFQATQMSSPSSASLRLNETSLSPLATSNAGQSNNFTAIGMSGGDAGVQGFTNSDFAEILYYNSVLSNENIQLVESYLKNKWSI